MSKVENAVLWMIKMANDNTHGYDQINRWGPDYDCSSFVITAFEQANIPVKSNGATYTGNMKNTFVKSGFEIITSKINLTTGAGLKRGDVLLNEIHHTAVCIGNGSIVQASINENGTITGGESGDQTGGEINIRTYYNRPWDCILRFPLNEPNRTISADFTYTIKAGDTLSAISADLGVSIGYLKRWNSIADINKITAGDVLKLHYGKIRVTAKAAPVRKKPRVEGKKVRTAKKNEEFYLYGGKTNTKGNKWFKVWNVENGVPIMRYIYSKHCQRI